MAPTFVLALALVLAAVVPAAAQLKPPNGVGVTAGHVHVNAASVDAQERFWTAVGAEVVGREPTIVQVPGMYVVVRSQAPTGGTAGSAINHLGIFVKDLATSVAAWRAAGLTWEPRAQPVNGQGFLIGPDGVRIEVYIDATIDTAIRMHHVHLMVPDPVAAQKWYAAMFGASGGERLTFKTATVPGVEIVLGKSDAIQAPTKGRAVDHLGFDVRDLDAFMARLHDAGMPLDGEAVRRPEVGGARSIFLTDPWGTELEITQGLAPRR